MKILHIIPDDKFWDVPVALFNEAETSNEYYVIVSDPASNCRFVDLGRVNVISAKDCSVLWSRVDIDAFMFHSLPACYYDYVLSIPKGKIVIWASWGYDIYYPQGLCPPICKIPLYKKETKRIKSKQQDGSGIRASLKREVKSYLHKHLRQAIQRDVMKQNRVLSRIDYCSTILPIEYSMICNNKYFRAEYFPFQYTRRSSSDNFPVIYKDSDAILIGNSSDWSNNHLDILKLIARRNIGNKLYLPLAYGDASCREAVIAAIQKNGANAELQKDMLPLTEYKEKLLNCRAAVFGHIRQQAMGNIYTCLLQGCKVFLFKDSIAYQSLKANGYIVYNIEDELTQANVLLPQAEDEIEHNRQLLLSFESKEATLVKLNASLKQIKKSINK